MAEIFVSHIEEEARVAAALVSFLGSFGLKSFLSSDNWQLRAGERWFERVTAELTEAKVVILLISKASVLRPWINFEGGWAWATGKIVVPLCIGQMTKGSMPRPYSDLQGLNLRSDYYDLVKDCLHHVRGGGLDQLTVLPMPFMENNEHAQALIKALDVFLLEGTATARRKRNA